ncbi:MAG TPA: ABC transporter ATP-binding protein [Acidimicrobiia bacterium]|jgi:branched-chain amino acid transport system ATP-binding protein|nr:ABC transporter ATP-binding protein [Acidimicrobiia bacterium]
MEQSPTILEVEDLAAGYEGVEILRGVSLRVPAGSLVSIIGPNGAGKSTLIKAIYGLVGVFRGSITFRPAPGTAVDIRNLTPNRITALGLNYVPQMRNVFPNLTVVENLEIGSVLDRGRFAERLEVVTGLFPVLGQRERQPAGTLSGGERQMLAVARALMTDPKVLLLDEPSAGLAPRVIEEMFERLLDIKRLGVTIMMVEQNARRALAASDYGYVLEAGRSRLEGSGESLLADPEVVALYLGG